MSETGETTDHNPGTNDGADPSADLGDPAPPASAAEADLQAVLRERDEMRSLAQQIQADFENFRKQAIRRETEAIDRGHGRSRRRAAAGPRQLRARGRALRRRHRPVVRKGVELVYAELVGVLEKAGLERIEANGQPFDPNEHDAVLQEEGDGEPVVVETMRTGYRLKGRVLRPAMVKVAS